MLIFLGTKNAFSFSQYFQLFVQLQIVCGKLHNIKYLPFAIGADFILYTFLDVAQIILYYICFFGQFRRQLHMPVYKLQQYLLFTQSHGILRENMFYFFRKIYYCNTI